MFVSDSYKELYDNYELWNKKPEVIIWGIGKNTEINIEFIKNNFNVLFFVDSNKEAQNKSYKDIPVYSPEKIFEIKSCPKILISPNNTDIIAFLKNKGLKFNKDFFQLDKIIAILYLLKEKQLVIPQIQISITTKCSLKCKACSLQMYKYPNPIDIEFENISTTVDNFFKVVDKVNHFTILGGEPLANPELSKIVEYISDKYNNRIESLSICTNGTIVPNENLLNTLKKNDVLIKISDYSNTLNYNEKIKELIAKLAEYDIEYRQNIIEEWVDLYNLSEEKNSDNMDNCGMFAASINNNRLFYCNLQWSALNLGLVKENENDYIKLEELNKENFDYKIKLLAYYLGYNKNKQLSVCYKCNGIAQYGDKIIKAAEQV